MKIKSFLVALVGLIFIVWSCKKEPTYQGVHDPEVIKNYRNLSTPVSRMDSLSTVGFITKQKLTELYELSSLYSSNSNDSLMREILFPQIQSYFLEKDTLNWRKIIREMDSLNVYFVEIGKMDFPQSDSLVADSVRKVNYHVRYFSKDRKLIDSLPKSAEFILKKEPKKFKHEFVFYFTNFKGGFTPNDTISSGVTR